MQTFQVKTTSIPKIGCNLDGLNRDQVKLLILRIFQEEEIEITVYSLKKPNPEREKYNNQDFSLDKPKWVNQYTDFRSKIQKRRT